MARGYKYIETIEKNIGLLGVLILVMVSLGGLSELTPLFIQARHWIIDSGAPTAVSAAGGWLQLLPSIAIFAAICAAAVVVFDRAAPRIAEEL